MEARLGALATVEICLSLFNLNLVVFLDRFTRQARNIFFCYILPAWDISIHCLAVTSSPSVFSVYLGNRILLDDFCQHC